MTPESLMRRPRLAAADSAVSILRQRCGQCHGETSGMSGFKVTTRETFVEADMTSIGLAYWNTRFVQPYYDRCDDASGRQQASMAPHRAGCH